MPALVTLTRKLGVACSLALILPTLSLSAPPEASRELDFVLGRRPDPGSGAKSYETCAACHGSAGEGVNDGSVPAIAGQPLGVVAKQLVEFRAGTRVDSRMQHFADTTHLSYSQEIADVASYISQLPPRDGSPPANDVLVTRGAMLYLRKCERCHGTMAEGKEAGFAPRLAGQHAEYLMRQLEQTLVSVRPAMREAHAAVTGSLTHDDIAALVASLSSL